MSNPLENGNAELIRAKKFLEVFADTYVSIYRINLNSLHYEPYSENTYYSHTYGQYPNYVDSLTDYINHDVHPDDRATCLATIQPDYLKKRFETEKRFSVLARDMAQGKVRWFLGEFIKESEPDYFVLAFTDITDAKEREMALDRERRKHEHIEQALAKEFLNVYLLNMDANRVEVIKQDHQGIRTEADEEFSYDKAVQEYVERCVPQGERTEVLECFSRETVRRKLSESREYSFTYRAEQPQGTSHFKCAFQRFEETGEILVGFQDVTEIIRAEQDHHTQLSRALSDANANLLIASALSRDYADVNVVDVVRDRFYFLKIANGLLSVSTRDSRRKFPYSEVWKIYINTKVHPEDRELVYEKMSPDYMMENLKVGESFSFTYRKKVGSQYLFHQMKVVRMDDQGGFLTAVRNVDDIAQVQYKLDEVQKEQEKKGKITDSLILYDALKSGTWGMEFSPDRELLSVTWSEDMRKVLGYTYEEFPDTLEAWNSRVYPDDYETVMKDYWDGVYERIVYNVKYRMKNVDGEIRWYRAVGKMLPNDDGTFSYRGVFYDINEETLLQENLASALQEAQDANKAKTIFLNNMSHDIRTPMNAIIGFTRAAEKLNNEVEHDSELALYLEKIRTSSDHLLSLINDVLDISRIESGKIKFSPVPTDLGEILEETLSIVKGALEGRDLNFEIHRQKDFPYVCTDSLRIKEILMNILSNAIKFTKDGGTIALTTEYFPGADEKHIVACATISDSGIGMSPEFMEHIFDEFAQEERSARTQYKGTGLGMSIVKKYVDLMNGTISVQSKFNEGTTFVIEIPMELAERNLQESTGSIGEMSLEGVKALMAEDNELNAEIATMVFQEMGLDITWVENGKLAVETFNREPADTYDLIFMDIMMPVMNGYEAATAIRKLNKGDAKSIPIVAMTANAFAEDIQKSLDSGMDAHIAKPINPAEIRKTIIRSLSKKRQ